MAFHYTLNANGHGIAATKETSAGSETTSYTCDELMRVDTVTYPDGRIADFDHDQLGNRTRMTMTTDGGVQVILVLGEKEKSARK